MERVKLNRLEMLVRQGLVEPKKLPLIRLAIKKIESEQTPTINERDVLFNLLNVLMDFSLTDEPTFQRLRTKTLQRENSVKTYKDFITETLDVIDSLIEEVEDVEEELEEEIVDEGKIKHPNQQALDVHEPEKDELTADDFKKLRKMKKGMKEETEKVDEALESEFRNLGTRRNDTGRELEDADYQEHTYKVPKGLKPQFDTPVSRYKMLRKAAKKSMKEEVEQVEEGKGMDAQRRWTRQISGLTRKPGSQLRRGFVKDAARKFYQRDGAEAVDQNASHLRKANQSFKRMQKEEK